MITSSAFLHSSIISYFISAIHYFMLSISYEGMLVILLNRWRSDELDACLMWVAIFILESWSSAFKSWIYCFKSFVACFSLIYFSLENDNSYNAFSNSVLVYWSCYLMISSEFLAYLICPLYFFLVSHKMFSAESLSSISFSFNVVISWLSLSI